MKREVFDALEVNAYCVSAAVDYLINVRRPLVPPYGTFDWVTLLISCVGLLDFVVTWHPFSFFLNLKCETPLIPF